MKTKKIKWEHFKKIAENLQTVKPENKVLETAKTLSQMYLKGMLHGSDYAIDQTFEQLK